MDEQDTVTAPEATQEVAAEELASTATAGSSTQEANSRSSTETLNGICGQMFGKISEYMEAKMLSTCEDYKLLRKLNDLSSTEYAHMLDQMKSINTQSTELKSKYSELRPYLDQVDAVEASIAKLHESALALDAYARRLETRFKELSK